MRYLTALSPLFLLLCLASCLAAGAELNPRALELHHAGYAELENEKPEKAEEAYLEVVKLVPGDPLGYANLAIAQLRQQKYDDALATIAKGLAVTPGNPALWTIEGEIRQWKGDLEGALEVLDRAAQKDPQNLETLYAAYQMAANLDGEKSDAVALFTLERLAELRPENVVVLLQLGQRSIAAGDRTRASGAYLRIGELLWQAPPIAERALSMVTDALKGEDVSKARVPAARLENVLKVTAMFRESLRELKTGIQGIPLRRFRDQPPVTAFGEPLDIRFAGRQLDERPTAGRGLVAGDFDGDEKADLARLARVAGDAGETTRLEIRLAEAGFAIAAEEPAVDLDRLLAVDLDNDGHLDLLGFGAERGAAWRGAGDGTFAPAEEAWGLAAAGAAAAVAVDFDIEGDLDLVLAGRGAGAAELYYNKLQFVPQGAATGPLAPVGKRALPELELEAAHAILASDLDRDGDLDLALGHGGGVVWLENLRQGRFADRTAISGLAASGTPSAVRDLASADLDNDGRPDLIAAGRGLVALRNLAGDRFETWPLVGLPTRAELAAVAAFDADNDGRLDLALAGEKGVTVLTQRPGNLFRPVSLAGGPAAAVAVAVADLDLDGDLDLAAAGEAGLHWIENEGGNENGWLAVRLRGLSQGNSKNNVLGVGSALEVLAGEAYQFREAAGDVVHFGLGSQEKAEVLRVEWTNGVPQNRLALGGRQRIVEEQLLKGSCPFLYGWDGERFTFVTDLLWAAPIGLPVGATKAPPLDDDEVIWAGSDPSELVRVDGLVPRDGRYELRITEELWEAAFFDHVRLWVVDHPATVEVASNLRVLPGRSLPEEVMASRDLRPVVRAIDGAGRDVTAWVAKRDEVYADGYEKSPYQGVAARPWSFTFDLGTAPAAPVRLHLDGWIFPSDASLNLALAQRGDLAPVPPRLEVETAAGWEALIHEMGFPAGKTKTMVIDTPPLPDGARRLRIVTGQWLHWDRVAWTTTPDDGAAQVVARLLPASAELGFRGFSKLVRRAPNAPHAYDYQRVSLESPWLAMPGRYTRHGDVSPLLEAPDDLSVILAPGDELALSFEARDLPPLAAGHRRTLFLESHGWDKDADRNTWEGHRLEPLPFRAMSGYPYAPGESYPDTPEHREYQERWLTREIR